MIKITRTMNNSLIIGETGNINNGVVISKPFALIPMEEGLRLIPLDIDLIGNQIESLNLSNDKIMYSTEPSKVISDEYLKLLNGETETETETETSK